MGTCQDEPEQLDGWNRTRVAAAQLTMPPPKACYPLESRPSMNLATITVEEIKTRYPQ